MSRFIIFDIEIFPNWWCVCYKEPGKSVQSVTSDDYRGWETLSKLRIGNVLIGFNIKNYDLKILYAIVNGATCERLYKLSKSIIDDDDSDKLNSYKFWNNFNFIDLWDDWRFGSLKEFEANCGMDIRESSISFDSPLYTEAQKQEILSYCMHDVEATEKLYEYRKSYIESKEVLADIYKIPLFTAYKSTNAKLSAIILKAEPKEFYDNNEFVLPDKVKAYCEKCLPKEVLDLFATLNEDAKSAVLFDNVIDFGIGGVHSVYKDPLWNDVKPIWTMTTDDELLMNVDVNSYYPNLLIHFNLLSRACDSVKIYKDMYELRLHWKQEMGVELETNGKTEYYYECKAKQQALKLILNTIYGAMKNKYNALYDPYNAGYMCYLGQILLTSLANNIYKNVPDVKIIQLNTDGIMLKVKKCHLSDVENLVKEWESLTELSMEFDYVKGMFQRDVNNYIELTGNEKKPYKLKGKWSNQADEDRPMVNLNAPITHKAVLNYYVKGISVEDTINECDDILDFCFTTKTGRSYDDTLYCYNNKYYSTNKVNRVVAVCDMDKGTIYKYKQDPPAEPVRDKCKTEREYNKKLRDWINRKEYFESVVGKPFGRIDKSAEIPDHCELINGLPEMIKNLDKDWYIEFAQNKIKELIQI